MIRLNATFNLGTESDLKGQSNIEGFKQSFLIVLEYEYLYVRKRLVDATTSVMYAYLGSSTGATASLNVHYIIFVMINKA